MMPSYLDPRLPSISLALTSSSTTACWIAWRDLLREELDRDPDNTNLENYLRCATEVLEWRAALDPRFHFWEESEL